MSVFDDLTSDLDWREGELAALKILLRRDDITPTQKEVLLRAAWALLYAHYEGYCKFCLTKFYDEAAKRLSDCTNLPKQTLAFSAASHLKRLRALPALDLLHEMSSFTNYLADTKPNFPEVDTESNLWPSVMHKLLADADIVVECVETHATKIETLVSRRNDIAHGQKNFIAEVGYYLTYEEAVYDVMYHLAYSVDDRLSRAPYG